MRKLSVIRNVKTNKIYVEEKFISNEATPLAKNCRVEFNINAKKK